MRLTYRWYNSMHPGNFPSKGMQILGNKNDMLVSVFWYLSEIHSETPNSLIEWAAIIQMIKPDATFEQ